MVEKTNTVGKITKFIFIGGAILVFVLLAYLIVVWVPKAISNIAGIGSSITKNTKTIAITADESEVNSGKPFSISWNYVETQAGEYYLSYSCDDSLSLNIQSANGPKKVLCNTPFKLGEGIDNISLVPVVSKKNTFVDSNITISYRDSENNQQVAYGDTVVTLKNIDTTKSSVNPYDGNLSGSTVVTEEVKTDIAKTPSTNSQPIIPAKTKTTTTNYGRPDLQISNIKEVRESTLSFNVFNIGTRSSGSWYFSYTDAENPSRVILSPLQMSLAPGQGMLTTVGFDSQSNNSQLINIVVDPYNSISESSESNNNSYVIIHGDENSNSNNYNSDEDADLVIDSIEVGRMSGSRFIEDDEIEDNDTAAVRFVVINEGGESTGSWKYEITDAPNDDDYDSGRQSTLRPGEERTITVEFDGIDSGIYNIKVKVDSDDDINEERENNNTKTKRLEVTN